MTSMKHFVTIDSIDSIDQMTARYSAKNNWTNSPQFENRGTFVDGRGNQISQQYRGVKYRLISKMERSISGGDRVCTVIFALSLTILTLGFMLISKQIRKLFTANKEIVYIGLRHNQIDPNLAAQVRTLIRLAGEKLGEIQAHINHQKTLPHHDEENLNDLQKYHDLFSTIDFDNITRFNLEMTVTYLGALLDDSKNVQVRAINRHVVDQMARRPLNIAPIQLENADDTSPQQPEVETVP